MTNIINPTWLDPQLNKGVASSTTIFPTRPTLRFMNGSILDNPAFINPLTGQQGSTDYTVVTGPNVFAAKTILDIYLPGLPTQSLSTDGSFTLTTGPADTPPSTTVTFQKQNSAHDASPMVLTNGTGIVMTPGSPAVYGGTSRTSPIIWTSLTSLLATSNITQGIRVWSEWADDPAIDNNYQMCGTDTSGGGFDPSSNNPTTGGGYAAFVLRGYDASNGGGGNYYTIFDVGGVQTLGESELTVLGGLSAANRVLVALSPAGLSNFEQTLTGPQVVGAWPTLTQLGYCVGAVQSSAAPFNIASSANFGAFWGTQRNGGGSWTTVLRRIRIDVLGFG